MKKLLPIKLTMYLLVALFFLTTIVPVSVHAAEAFVTAESGVSDARLDQFRGYTETVLRFYRERYGFTPAWPVRITVAPDKPGFIALLQREGYSAKQATRQAEVAVGMYMPAQRKIVIQDDPFRNLMDLSDVIAHELFHQFQWELKGNATAHQWLLEGSAERAGFDLGQWSGKGPSERKKEELINHLYKRVTGEIDPYDLIDNGPRWKSLVSEGRNVYGTAKNMTDYLADQFGDPVIIRYFTELGQTGNRESAFLRAFGMSHNEFIEKYKAYTRK